jgi:hypothetical protein
VLVVGAVKAYFGGVCDFSLGPKGLKSEKTIAVHCAASNAAETFMAAKAVDRRVTGCLRIAGDVCVPHTRGKSTRESEASGM